MTSASRGVAVTTFGNLIPPLAALVTQPLLAQGLGVTGRGELAAATAPLLLATSILTLGIPESLTFHLARRAERIARFTGFGVGALVLFGLAGSGGVAILAVPLSSGNRELAQLIMIAGLAITPTLLIAALRGLVSGIQAWTLVALERIGNGVLRLLIVVVLFATGTLNPLTATITVAVTTFIGGLVYVVAIPRIRSTETTANAGGGTGSFFRYAAQVWLGTASGIVLSRLDQLIMTPLSGVGELGYYAIAVSISEVILVFNSAVRDVMFAVESHDPDPVRVSKASRLSTLATVAAALVIAALCPWAIPFFFGQEFSAAIPSTYVLLVAVVLGNPGSVAGAALSGRDRPELRSFSLIVAAIINVVALVILVPRLGALGASFATLIGNSVAGVLNIVWLKVFFGMPTSTFYRFRVGDITDLWSAGLAMLRRRP